MGNTFRWMLNFFFICSAIIFPQKLRIVTHVANDSLISEINPYLTKYWYGGWFNNYDYLATNTDDKKVSPVWLTFVETDFNKTDRIVAYNLLIDKNGETKFSDKFIISDTLLQSINRQPKIENFLGKPVAVWQSEDSTQSNLVYSVFSDSVWGEPVKITNDTLTEFSVVFYTRDAFNIEEQSNLSNVLFWKANNSILFTSLTSGFIWDTIKTLYSSNSEINNLSFRTTLNNDSYLLFTEKGNDSTFVKCFVKYKDSLQWVGPVTVIKSGSSISQIEINLSYEECSTKDFILLTYVKNATANDTIFTCKDSLQFEERYHYYKPLKIHNGTEFISNTLLSGGCVIMPTPYFFIATKTDSNTQLFLSDRELTCDNYGYFDYATKNEVNKLTMSGLFNGNLYAVAWSEYDGKQYDINFFLNKIEFGDVKKNGNKKSFLLLQNYPNPFNPATQIKYTISTPPSLPPLSKGRDGEGLFVTLKVYNILGKEISTLVNKKQKPGTYQIIFDATNLPSGVYYYHLTCGSYSETKKMILMK